VGEPRIRVSAILRWRGRILLVRHNKPGGAVWLLPGGGVRSGESLVTALHRELREETRLVSERRDLPLEGPVAIVDSIAPDSSPVKKHVVHVIFAADVTGSLEEVGSEDSAVGNHRLFRPVELEDLVLHPPIHRFLRRWQPGDPAVYLGKMWVP